jgi:hypothetical protein
VFQLFLAKAKRFYLCQKFWNKTKTFLCVPTFFLAKAKRYYLIQELRNRSKTFGFSSLIFKNQNRTFCSLKKNWKLNTPIAFGPKILRSERERFVPIMNFVSKTNIFDFFGDVCRKTKAKDLEKTLV